MLNPREFSYNFLWLDHNPFTYCLIEKHEIKGLSSWHHKVHAKIVLKWIYGNAKVI